MYGLIRRIEIHLVLGIIVRSGVGRLVINPLTRVQPVLLPLLRMVERYQTEILSDAVLQAFDDAREERSVDGSPGPALSHYLVEQFWAVGRPLEGASAQDEVDDFLVGLALVGLFGQRGHFPQDHSVTPYVRVRGEDAVGYALGCHPTDGEQTLAFTL